MMKYYLFALTCLLMANVSFSQTSSSDVGPPTKTTLIKCPVVRVNTQTIKSPTTDPVGKFLDLGGVAATCTGPSVFAGTAVIAGGQIGGGFSPACPSDKPYLGGFQETWAGSFLAAGNITLLVNCCGMPQPPMSFTSGATNWVADTICP